MSSDDRPVTDILQDIIRNIEDIVRAEVRLAKSEMSEEFAKAQSAGVFLGIGTLGSIFSIFFLLLAIVFALSNRLPNWAAALIVALALAIVGGILLGTGAKRLKRLHSAPHLFENQKGKLEWAKRPIK
jgi:uncharacterized membrane protein YqjE